MSLFGFLKKKKGPTHEQKLQAVYEAGIKEPFKSHLFPNGTKQLDKIVCSLAKILDLNLDTCDPVQYLHLTRMYSEVVTLRVVTKSTNNYIMGDLQKRHPDLVKDRNTARKIMVFSTLHMEDFEFSLANPDHASKMNALEYMFIEIEKVANQNDSVTKRYIHDSDYGLVKEKPVYSDGSAGIDKYLASLLTIDGEDLVWSRVNVHKVDSVNGLVDEYEGRLPSGEVYRSVFCCLYANNNSDVIPNGFTQKSVE